MTVVQVYPDGLIRCEYVRPPEENLKNHQRNSAQSNLRTAREPGRNADLDQAQPCLAQDWEGLVADGPARRSDQADREAVFGTRSSLHPKFDVELSRNADNNISAGEGHHNACSAVARMTSNLYAGGANQAHLQSEPCLAEQAPVFAHCLEPKADRPAACEAKRSGMHSAPDAVQPGRARPAGIGCTTGPQAGG